MLAVVVLEGPKSGKMRGVLPRTQPFWATAAVLHHNAVSRRTATLATRWLKLPRLQFLGDCGIVIAESAISDALTPFTALNEILACEPKSEKSRRGARLECFGVSARLLVVEDVCRAHLSISPDRVQRRRGLVGTQ